MSAPVRLYIARHAETTWNLAGRYQGRRESMLSARGMQQTTLLADAIGAIVPRITRVIASPLHRTRATAEASAERLRVAVESDDALLEIAHGTWEGRMRDEIATHDQELYRAWRETPASVAFAGGEALGDVLARWHRFRANFVASEATLLVTHDAVVRVALVDILGRSLDHFWQTRVENAAFAVVEIRDAQWTLISESEAAHLGGRRADIGGQAL